MEIETLKKSHKKEIVIGACLFIILAIVLIVRFTFAKYELIKSIKIAEGTINYKVPDFKIMAMYKQKDDATCTEDSCYNEMVENEIMPESGYIINESKSYCELNGTKDSKAKIYTDDSGNHVISAITKGSRCYLYFDKKLSAGEMILANVIVKDSPSSFTGVATTNEGVFKTKDDDGDTYYFRGAVENNYVKFGKNQDEKEMYWRIIRINGDGSIRLIYDGTEPHANGTQTSDSIAVANQTFSPSGAVDNNMYVGFKYTSGQVHGLGTKSNALQELETWYTSNLLSYASKIDTNAGFCGDRTPSTSVSTSNGSGGTGTTTTYYGAYIRFLNGQDIWNTTQTPTFKCKNISDLYTVSTSTKGNKSLTYPIGLITADEVVYAGGFGNVGSVAINQNYYLYNGQIYWTMSPYNFNGTYAIEFAVFSSGNLYAYILFNAYGIRPVINLRADVTLSGKGTQSFPYIVS